MRIYFKYYLIFLILFQIHDASASYRCESLFNSNYFNQAIKGKSVDTFQLFLEFENVYNRPIYSRPVLNLKMNASPVSKKSINVNLFGSKDQNQILQKILFINPVQVLWFKHPFNTDSSVPYYRQKETDALDVYMSSSRSMIFSLNDEFYSIRTPTDQPRGVFDSEGYKKTIIGPELKIAIAQMQLVNQVENQFGFTKNVILAKEIAVIQNTVSKKSKDVNTDDSGYMIRDLSFLKNKNKYYMPAFSVETVGKIIAKKHGEKFSEFWLIRYAENLGRVKAQLLIHYGLHMEFPHGQNLIIELDHHLMPTGRFVLRDIDDMSQYTPVLEAMNEVFNEQSVTQINIDRNNQRDDIDLYWRRFSSRVFTWSEDPHVYSKKIYNQWESAHEDAFIKEVAKLLDVRSKELGKNIQEVSRTLSSTWGISLIKQYFYKKYK